MTAVTSTDQELVDFIASETTPEAILGFRPSKEASLRPEDLIEREEAGTLSPEEKVELDHCLYWEHLVRMVKAKARMSVPGAQRPGP